MLILMLIYTLNSSRVLKLDLKLVGYSDSDWGFVNRLAKYHRVLLYVKRARGAISWKTMRQKLILIVFILFVLYLCFYNVYLL